MSYEQLKQDVEANGNVQTVAMQRLRDDIGASKLGSNVREQISKELEGLGLGHIPVELPPYQENLVRVFKRGTDVADVIRAAVEPGPKGDAKLKDYASKGGSQFSEIIEKIRELVTD